MGGRSEFNEAKELLTLLNAEIRKGYDAGMSEEEASKQVKLGKFTSFLNQDRIGQITRMAYLAYRGELQ